MHNNRGLFLGFATMRSLYSPLKSASSTSLIFSYPLKTVPIRLANVAAAAALFRLVARNLVLTILEVVPLSVVVLLRSRKSRCSTTVMDRTTDTGPVTPPLVTLGVDLRTGLHNEGLDIVRSLEGNTFSEFATMDVLLSRTLLNTPLAMTILNEAGLRTTPTEVVLIHKRLMAILGHLAVTLPMAPCYNPSSVNMPVPLMEASPPLCATVTLKVRWIT